MCLLLEKPSVFVILKPDSFKFFLTIPAELYVANVVSSLEELLIKSKSFFDHRSGFFVGENPSRNHASVPLINPIYSCVLFISPIIKLRETLPSKSGIF